MVSAEGSERFLSSAWLPEMDRASREALLGALREHRAAAGTTLLHAGVANERVAFLLEGSLVVTQAGRDASEHVLCTIQAPSMFGLTSFFRPTPPDFSIVAQTAVHFLTLDRAAHQALRAADPVAAEQLAVAALHVLSDRMDLLDRRISEDLAGHPADHPRVTEWSSFRARLLGDPTV